MIINWVTTKAQQFLPGQDAGLDELNVSFDFALSPEIMDLLYAQNDGCMAATAPGSLAAFPPSMEVRSGGSVPTVGALGDAGAVAEADQSAEDAEAAAVIRFELDEYELALT
ncbi:MAG: hypothetical protein ACXWEV_08770 [Methylobacter sp.]